MPEAWPSALLPPLLPTRGQTAMATMRWTLTCRRCSATRLDRPASSNARRRPQAAMLPRTSTMLSVQPDRLATHLRRRSRRAAGQIPVLRKHGRRTERRVRLGTLPIRPHAQTGYCLCNMSVRRLSQLLLAVAAMRRPARVRMVRCSFARAPEHTCQHRRPHTSRRRNAVQVELDAHPSRLA